MTKSIKLSVELSMTAKQAIDYLFKNHGHWHDTLLDEYISEEIGIDDILEKIGERVGLTVKQVKAIQSGSKAAEWVEYYLVRWAEGLHIIETYMDQDALYMQYNNDAFMRLHKRRQKFIAKKGKE